MFYKLFHKCYSLQKYSIRGILVAAFLTSNIEINAQKSYHIDHLGIEDGLLSDLNFAIFQDSQGFIWIGGNSGLQRFDGQSFITFTYDKETLGTGIQEMTVRHITETKDGSIWVGTDGSGIYQIKNCEIVNHIGIDPNKGTSLPGGIVEDILEDDSGRLWVATNKGLVCLEENEMQVFRSILSDSSSLSHDRIYSLCITQEKELWVGTQNGLNKYLGDGKFKRFYADSSQKKGLGGNFIHDIIEDDGHLWLGLVEGGINKLNLENFSVKRYEHEKNDPVSISNNKVLDLEMDDAGNLFISR